MEQNDTVRLGATDRTRRKIYVLAEMSLADELVAQLEAGGFNVDCSDDPDALEQALLTFRPDLVILGERLPRKGGRQSALAIRANGSTFTTPIVGVLADLPALTVLAWLRVGAVDLWRYPFTRDVADRARELIDECDRSRISEGSMKARLLKWAERSKLDGTVISHPGTPFEGRATFSEGVLTAAQFGTLQGERALGHFIELEDGPVVWEESVTTSAPMTRAQNAGFRARVLVVEDDPSLRHLVTRQLQAAQYTVEGAEDGRQGLQLAAQKPWDVVVADLDLPKLDGWGLLRELRNDVSLREISSLVLSAHENLVDTLKAARSGARAYLKKSGRAKELLDTIALLATPRASVWESLRSKRETRVEVRAVGALWLLRTLAELDCAGRLELEDELGVCEIEIAQGQLISAIAQVGSHRMNGSAAISTLIGGRGSGRFLFSSLEAPESAPWLFDVIDETCESMRETEKRRMEEAIARPAALLLNEELASLFASLATVAELKVLEAVRRSSDDLETLAASVSLPMSEVEPALAVLLRRGVLVSQS